ncbi:hypothetical protein PALI_b0289 [Pseudoalteromonas aliena SW19]|uniref:Uncharacterized protein n=1 Tax=Pseudoalteromonas aliena SW19 TaxID=1314866 RepID=A0ABR9E3Z7_9GAMM|nr:hypothetical protein [Pseudoalteromonas aliena SW19]
MAGTLNFKEQSSTLVAMNDNFLKRYIMCFFIKMFLINRI